MEVPDLLLQSRHLLDRQKLLLVCRLRGRVRILIPYHC